MVPASSVSVLRELPRNSWQRACAAAAAAAGAIAAAAGAAAAAAGAAAVPPPCTRRVVQPLPRIDWPPPVLPVLLLSAAELLTEPKSSPDDSESRCRLCGRGGPPAPPHICR